MTSFHFIIITLLEIVLFGMAFGVLAGSITYVVADSWYKAKAKYGGIPDIHCIQLSQKIEDLIAKRLNK